MSLSTSTPQTSTDSAISTPQPSVSSTTASNRPNQPLTIQPAKNVQHNAAQRKQQQDAKVQSTKVQNPKIQSTERRVSVLKSSSGLSIPLLLEWWQQRKRLANSRSNLYATLPKGEDRYLQAYYRLMEIYSVVKSGGVKTQTEAVEAFSQRESNLLTERLAAIETDQSMDQSAKNSARAHIQQELGELHHASSWRLKALKNITSEEEAAVKTYLPDIEKMLTMQVHCA